MCSRLWIFRQKTNGKVIFSLKSHLHPPNYYSSTLIPNLFEQNQRFLLFSCMRIVLGLVSESLHHWHSPEKSSPKYISKWDFFSSGGSWSFFLGAVSAVFEYWEMLCHQSLSLHLGAVVLRLHSRTTFLSQSSSRKSGSHVQLILSSLLQTTLLLNRDLREGLQITVLFNTKCIYYISPKNLPTGGKRSSWQQLLLPGCLKAFHLPFF